MSKVKYFIAILRPNHWVKNFFVIIPVIFSKKIGDLHTDFSVLILTFASYLEPIDLSIVKTLLCMT